MIEDVALMAWLLEKKKINLHMVWMSYMMRAIRSKVKALPYRQLVVEILKKYKVYKSKETTFEFHILDKDTQAKMTYIRDVAGHKIDRIEGKIERMWTLIKGLVKTVQEMKQDMKSLKERAEVSMEENSV